MVLNKCFGTYKFEPLEPEDGSLIYCSFIGIFNNLLANCCGASEPEASERSSSLIGVVCSQKVNF